MQVFLLAAGLMLACFLLYIGFKSNQLYDYDWNTAAQTRHLRLRLEVGNTDDKVRVVDVWIDRRYFRIDELPHGIGEINGAMFTLRLAVIAIIADFVVSPTGIPMEKVAVRTASLTHFRAEHLGEEQKFTNPVVLFPYFAKHANELDISRFKSENPQYNWQYVFTTLDDEAHFKKFECEQSNHPLNVPRAPTTPNCDEPCSWHKSTSHQRTNATQPRTKPSTQPLEDSLD